MASQNSHSNSNSPQNRDHRGGPINTAAPVQYTLNRPRVAAVIRPAKNVAGTDKTIRIDAAEPSSVRGPHRRTDELQDYVGWLQQHAPQTPAAKSNASSSSSAPATKPQVAFASTTQPVATQSQSREVHNTAHLNQPATIARSNTATSPVPTGHANTRDNSIDSTSKRVDSAHSPIGKSSAAPAPNTAAADFKFEADLERILKKLNMPEVLLPKTQTTAQPGPATPVASFNLKPAHATQTTHAAGINAHSTAASQSTTTSPTAQRAFKIADTSPRADRTTQRNDAGSNHEEIIRTVSEAIASVLNERNENEIAAGIRERLSQKQAELHRASVATHGANPTTANSTKTTANNSATSFSKTATVPISPKGLAHSSQQQSSTRAQTPTASTNKPTNKTSVPPSTATDPLEIPLSVAAWDVDDFRWPQVSQQMITVGAGAVQVLANSVFQTLGANQKRLAVVSPGRGEGTTSIAISLSRWAAAHGRRVLLVDADLASPGLTNQVGLASNMSWINAVASSLPASEAIIRSAAAPICILPLAPIVSRVGWPRFIYDQLGELTEQVADSFDLIVFDIGPASQLIAELSQSRLMLDASLIVHNGSNPSNFVKAKERLELFGLNRFVIAQNAAQPTVLSNVA